MDPDSERAPHNKCLATPYLLCDRRQQGFTLLVVVISSFLLFLPRGLPVTLMPDVTGIYTTHKWEEIPVGSLQILHLQSEIMELHCEVVVVGGLGGSVFYRRC